MALYWLNTTPFTIGDLSAALTRLKYESIDCNWYYKARQAEILEEMGRHQEADENFYVTANMVMNLVARSRAIFLSSEVAEKRQILNLAFQNLQLNDQKNLILEVKEPFKTLMEIKNGSIRSIDCTERDSNP